ncbi:unnamed protein product [Somion occarium]|uniref:Uncharacterized protein n=1 Tax=Somion occarium TaxID=3059160 RepID=A0ABP1DQF2_9APHY
MAFAQSTPSPVHLDTYMAKHADPPTWERIDTSSVGETTMSQEYSASDERHTPYRGAYIPRVTSRWAFAQKPVRTSAANEVSRWPPPLSRSPSFCFNPFGDSEGPAVGPAHFAPAPIPRSMYVPGRASLALHDPNDTVYVPSPRQCEWVPLRSTDATYSGIGVHRLVDEPVADQNAVTRPQTIQRELIFTHRLTPAYALAHFAVPAVSQPSGSTATTLYDDEADEDDFVLRALQLPWLEYNLIDVEEFTPPTTPPLSPSTLADDEEDLTVLEKEEELREWQEASPLARDVICLPTGW